MDTFIQRASILNNLGFTFDKGGGGFEMFDFFVLVSDLKKMSELEFNELLLSIIKSLAAKGKL